jgi:hypothetical protein
MLKLIKKMLNIAVNDKKKVGVSIPLDRQILLEKALKVHQGQSKLLENLDSKMKNQLKTIAMDQVFKIKKKRLI